MAGEAMPQQEAEDRTRFQKPEANGEGCEGSDHESKGTPADNAHQMLPATEESLPVTVTEASDREQQPTTRTSIPEKRSITEDCLPPASSVKKFYKEYFTRDSSRSYFDALPHASELAQAEERKLTVAFVARQIQRNRNTVSRYFNALIKAGLTTWKGIAIPHGEKRVAKTDWPQGS